MIRKSEYLDYVDDDFVNTGYLEVYFDTEEEAQALAEKLNEAEKRANNRWAVAVYDKDRKVYDIAIVERGDSGSYISELYGITIRNKRTAKMLACAINDAILNDEGS